MDEKYLKTLYATSSPDAVTSLDQGRGVREWTADERGLLDELRSRTVPFDVTTGTPTR